MSSSIKDSVEDTESTPEATNTTANKRRQWLWFIGLWCAGLLTITVIGMIIKFFMKLI